MHVCYGAEVVRGLEQDNQGIMKEIIVVPRCNSLFVRRQTFFFPDMI